MESVYLNTTDFGDREFFFLNLMEAHDFYNPPAEYRTVEPPDVDSINALAEVLDSEESIDSRRYRQAYHDSVSYLTEEYRIIHDALKDHFDYVVTVFDHGEAFGEGGIYGHVPSLIPEIVHVPLSIWGRDVNEGTSDTAVNLLDVRQTILTLPMSSPRLAEEIYLMLTTGRR